MRIERPGFCEETKKAGNPFFRICGLLWTQLEIHFLMVEAGGIEAINYSSNII